MFSPVVDKGAVVLGIFPFIAREKLNHVCGFCESSELRFKAFKLCAEFKDFERKLVR